MSAGHQNLRMIPTPTEQRNQVLAGHQNLRMIPAPTEQRMTEMSPISKHITTKYQFRAQAQAKISHTSHPKLCQNRQNPLKIIKRKKMK